MKMTLLYIVLGALMTACGSSGSTSSISPQDGQDTAATATVPGYGQYDGGSALELCRQQCEFGPRVPGTTAHARCAEWLLTTLQASCDTVILQTGTVQTATEGQLGIKNIIGVINPEASQRLLLLAHWDTRPWADNDPDEANHTKPVMGANDGASGVGVLLQLAKQLKQAGTSLGVDILLVDAEDMGVNDNEDSWGLGTQYWAGHPHVEGYKPLFGILLDMVGASDATFSREYYSMQYASGFVDLVWKNAAGNHFINAQGGAVTDDHIFVNRAGIPCIDIIDMRSDSPTGFCPVWHTIHDTIDGIDPATMGEVGQTLLNVIADLTE
jgi:hypothetical protein